MQSRLEDLLNEYNGSTTDTLPEIAPESLVLPIREPVHDVLLEKSIIKFAFLKDMAQEDMAVLLFVQ